MNMETIDITGLQRTQAVFKIMSMTVSLQPGDILDVIGSASTFRKDMHSLCERLMKDYVFLETGDTSVLKCRIKF